MEDRPPVSLAKARLYAKIDEIEQNRPRAAPPAKRSNSLPPLAILFVFLIAVIVIEERALINAERELAQLKSDYQIQGETLRLANEKIINQQQQEAEAESKPEQMKRRAVRKRKPRITGQNELFSGGDGPAATLR
jgi:hypothetical protein